MAHFTKAEIAAWPGGFKKCSVCREFKELQQFCKHPGGVFGRDSRCKTCRKPERKRQYESYTFELTLYRSAKWRAAQRGIEFNISLTDIVIPSVCPILEVPIVLERNHDYAPSLDRTDPNKGYTRDNVMVVSKRGNMLKNNMTENEAIVLLKWFQNQSKTGSRL